MCVTMRQNKKSLIGDRLLCQKLCAFYLLISSLKLDLNIVIGTRRVQSFMFEPREEKKILRQFLYPSKDSKFSIPQKNARKNAPSTNITAAIETAV